MNTCCPLWPACMCLFDEINDDLDDEEGDLDALDDIILRDSFDEEYHYMPEKRG